MSDEQDIKHRSYRVILKSGDTATFVNDNNFDNYKDRLLSGIYGIMPRNGGENIPITTENVVSIEEIEADAPQQDAVRYKAVTGAGRPEHLPSPTAVPIVDGDVILYPTEVGNDEQEQARKREILSDE